MKKILVILLVAAIVIACTACSGTKYGKCSTCGQEEKLYKYTLQGKFGNAGNRGEVEYLCDDCIRTAKMFGY